MGKKRGTGRLLTSELEILEVLWTADGLTIVEVQRGLESRTAGKPAGYTTVQTRLNRMVTKGLAKRSRTSPARYMASVSREQVTSMDLSTLLNRVSGGQVIPLVAQLVRDQSFSADEYDELRTLIDQAEIRARTHGHNAKKDGPNR